MNEELTEWLLYQFKDNYDEYFKMLFEKNEFNSSAFEEIPPSEKKIINISMKWIKIALLNESLNDKFTLNLLKDLLMHRIYTENIDIVKLIMNKISKKYYNELLLLRDNQRFNDYLL